MTNNVVNNSVTVTIYPNMFSSDTLARMYEELYAHSQFYSARLILNQLDMMVGREESVKLISEYRSLIDSPHKLIG